MSDVRCAVQPPRRRARGESTAGLVAAAVVRLTVVTGPPCGGKSTYIRERAAVGDVVIDLDRLALALTSEDTEHHDYGGHVLAVAQAARRAAVDTALDLDARVWLIDTIPTPRSRARYREVGAEVVVCDPGEDVVFDRIGRERPARIRQVALDYYAGALRQSSASSLAW